MPRTISGKLTLLAGACALSLAFAPNAIAAGGGGGGMGGGHFGGTMTTTSPSTARPMVAPVDQRSGPSAQDLKSHAPFNNLNNPPTPQPASPGESSHATQRTTTAARPEPITGSRIPPAAQSGVQLDPPPPSHGSTN